MARPEVPLAQEQTLVIKTATAGDVTFTIEIAATRESQAKGLMFRRSLAKKSGMLFVYEEPQIIHMWMRSTYIPLDMIFIDRTGLITKIARETEPFSEETIASGGNVTGVLEIAGGEAKALGIRTGDRVVHPHFSP
ncbi:MAG: DUF192 domain-containing protein [Hyphomicrobiaceae bacterium]